MKTRYVAGLLTTLLAVASTAHAQTNDELKAQVEAMQILLAKQETRLAQIEEGRSHDR